MILRDVLLHSTFFNDFEEICGNNPKFQIFGGGGYPPHSIPRPLPSPRFVVKSCGGGDSVF